MWTKFSNTSNLNQLQNSMLVCSKKSVFQKFVKYCMLLQYKMYIWAIPVKTWKERNNCNKKVLQNVRGSWKVKWSVIGLAGSFKGIVIKRFMGGGLESCSKQIKRVVWESWNMLNYCTCTAWKWTQIKGTQNISPSFLHILNRIALTTWMVRISRVMSYCLYNRSKQSDMCV